VASWIAVAGPAPDRVALCLGGLATLIRLSRWRTTRCCREPLVWSLHAGYGWLGLGLILAGASVLDPGACPSHGGDPRPADRSRRGHDPGHDDPRDAGPHRPRAFADRATVALYAAINLAAACRIAAAFAPGAVAVLLVAAAIFWVAAFALFIVRYGPMLLRPRLAS
jgi:uncharacterized protein involved in response to NO